MIQTLTICPWCRIRLNAFGVQFQRCPCGWDDTAEWPQPDELQAQFDLGHGEGRDEGYGDGFRDARYEAAHTARKHDDPVHIILDIESLTP